MKAQKDEVECKKYRSLAGEEIKMKNYKRAAQMYLKALNFCDACDKAAGNDIVFDNLKYSYETMWKEEKDEARQKELADTVVWIYELRIKQCTEVSDDWMASYGYFLGKAKINYVKSAELLSAHLAKVKEEAGVTNIYQFYSSSYMAYATTKDTKWRDTLVNSYFVLNDYLDKLKDHATWGKYTEQIRGAIEKILMERILKDCDEISNVLKVKVDQFGTMSGDAKKDFCKKAIALLEKRECIESEVYPTIMKEYIPLLPEDELAEGAYAYGKFLEGQKKWSEAKEYYEKAIDNIKDESMSDKYKSGKLRTMFRMGSYKACFSLAKSIGGEYRGEALKIAAQCIAQLANSCGVSTIERKANYYLALDYLDKAAASGASVGGLKASYAKNCPTREEKFKESWKNGKTISLSCWGESTTVRDTE